MPLLRNRVPPGRRARLILRTLLAAPLGPREASCGPRPHLRATRCAAPQPAHAAAPAAELTRA